MKLVKRTYLKGWLENTLIAITILAVVIMGGIVDKIETPIIYMLPFEIVIVVNVIILMKYSKLVNKDDKDNL